MHYFAEFSYVEPVLRELFCVERLCMHGKETYEIYERVCKDTFTAKVA